MPEKFSKEKMENLIGKKFDRLTIIKYLGHYKTTQKDKRHWFLCNCDCGKKNIIKSYNYFFHSTVKLKSCGCWNTEHTIIFNKETKTNFDNEYKKNKDGSYTIYCIKRDKKFKVIVDADFFQFLKALNRRLQIDCRGYAFITRENSTKQLFIHNLVIFGFDYYDKHMNINVDHINTKNIRDDRKDNLRPADNFENTQNAKRRKDNTCGIKGFTIHISKNRPTAHITVRIQAYKKRIGKDFALSPKGLKQAIIWNHNERLKLHNNFSNFGYDIKNKTLKDIVKEQSQIFINNLTEQQKKVFYNNGYTYKPIKNKPRRN